MLIFKWKKNGKGKEFYSNGALKFDGEYFNNREMIGTKYDKEGKVIYALNNINGKGKEYDNNNLLIFEGEYLNGKRNGK